MGLPCHPTPPPDTYLRRGHTAVLYYSSGAAALLALLFVLSLPYRAPAHPTLGPPSSVVSGWLGGGETPAWPCVLLPPGKGVRLPETLLPTLQLKNGRNLLLAAASGFPIGVIDPRQKVAHLPPGLLECDVHFPPFRFSFSEVLAKDHPALQ